MFTHEVIGAARDHVSANKALEGSARLALSDALALYEQGKVIEARRRAQTSLAYSLGIFNNLYQQAIAP